MTIDATNIYRHNWTAKARAEAGYSEETLAQTVARLGRAATVSASARAEYLKLAVRMRKSRATRKGGAA